MFSVMGFSFSGAAPNQGIIFVRLKPFDERHGRRRTRRRRSSASCSAAVQPIPGAIVVPFPPPSIHGLGRFGGFKFEVLDQSGGPHRARWRRRAQA